MAFLRPHDWKTSQYDTDMTVEYRIMNGQIQIEDTFFIKLKAFDDLR